ncbi:MAG: pentapeptide repeat-containing protein [Patescibacteria group bacterium]
MSDSNKRLDGGQVSEASTSPTAEARQSKVTDGIVTAVQATAEAVGGAVAEEEQESFKQQLNFQGFTLLKAGEVRKFNMLRDENPTWYPDFSGVNNFFDVGVNLSGINLNGVNLSGANLFRANLSRVDFCTADLSGADFLKAKFFMTSLYVAKLSGAKNLTPEQLSGTFLFNARIDASQKPLLEKASRLIMESIEITDK